MHKISNDVRIKHGMRGTRLYRIWRGMKSRCNVSNNHAYKDYGGRGIKVCNGWNNSFIPFMNWAFENGYKDSLSIDRINNDGNYEPSNCRWATNAEQHRNRSDNLKYKGETSVDASYRLGGCKTLVINRIYHRKWSIEKAFTTPKGIKGKKVI